MKKTLYNNSFQLSLIWLMLNDSRFFEQIYDIVDPDYFTGEDKKYTVKFIKEFYNKYKKNPSLKVLVDFSKGQFERKKIDELFYDSLTLLYNELSRLNLGEQEAQFYRDETVTFFREQAAISALLDSVDMVRSGDLEKIKEKINKVFEIGVDVQLGHEYKDDVIERYAKESHTPVATPWKCLNDKMRGGPGAGHIGIIIAGPGVGKTWALCALGLRAAKDGHDVLHYSFELAANYVGTRYDSILTGQSIDSLYDNPDIVIKHLDKIKGRVIIKKYPVRSVSVNGLRAHINKSISQGVKPGLIIVDYGDLIKLDGDGENRFQLERMIEDLRNLGEEFGTPVWTASQVNRKGYEKDVVGLDDLAEAFAKANPADIVIGLTRKSTKLAKNRLGPDDIVFRNNIDYSCGLIEILDEYEELGTNNSTQSIQHKTFSVPRIDGSSLSNKLDEILHETKNR